MGGEFIEIRITHPWEFIQPAPEAVRPRLLDWQVDAKGRHVAWRYRITDPGVFEWTSPHGHTYRRDRTGTTPIEPSTADPPDIPRPRRP